jgi:hypothetical protein
MLNKFKVICISLFILFPALSFATDVEVSGGLKITNPSATAGATAVYGTASAGGAGQRFGGQFYSYSNTGYGVIGSALATGAYQNFGGAFFASGDNGYAVSGQANGVNGIGVFGYAPSTGLAGAFNGSVHVMGDLTVDGNKHFIQPHTKDPTKEIVYVAAEGPEAMVFFRGTAALKNGMAVINLPEYFSMVASKEGVMVQFTPRSMKSKGLAAVIVTNERIVVRELLKGKGKYEFDYFVTAKRAGFERHQPIAANTHFKPGVNETAKAFENRYEGDTESIKALRAMLIANGILTPEGKLNRELALKLGWEVKEEDLALLSK